MSNHKNALVTGASSGIGNELARLLAQDGFNLVLVARSEEKLFRIAKELEEKYKIYVKVIVKDLGDQKASEQIFNETQNEGLKISVLINNAGFATHGKFLETDLNKELNLLNVNIFSLTSLTKFYANEMINFGGGKILNVSSTAAFQAGPLMAVYYASKAYVQSFSTAIAEEFKKSNITVTTLCPGPTKTAFQKRANVKDAKLFKDSFIMDAATVAKDGYEGLKNGKEIIITGVQNKISAYGSKFLPRKFVSHLVKELHKE